MGFSLPMDNYKIMSVKIITVAKQLPQYSRTTEEILPLLDIFSEDFAAMSYDIVLCTLTLHHFTNEEILNIMTIFNNNASMGIVVNDLHRSKLSYKLFEMICMLFNLSKMSREDGLVSILRGFKKNELEDFSKKLNLKNYTINWKWAFRYQWIITKV